MGQPGVVVRFRVMDPDHCPFRTDGGGHVQRGRVADIIGLRLERGPKHRDLLASERPADQVPGQVDRPLTAGVVDLVDLVQELHRASHSQLGGPGHERPDVFRQAAAAETKARGEEAAADPVSWPSASARVTTSAPAASHTSAIALMNETLVARKALAATLASSAVARSVVMYGVPAPGSGRIPRAGRRPPRPR